MDGSIDPSILLIRARCAPCYSVVMNQQAQYVWDYDITQEQFDALLDGNLTSIWPTNFILHAMAVSSLVTAIMAAIQCVRSPGSCGCEPHLRTAFTAAPQPPRIY